MDAVSDNKRFLIRSDKASKRVQASAVVQKAFVISRSGLKSPSACKFEVAR
jgi:hypothetical protein